MEDGEAGPETETETEALVSMATKHDGSTDMVLTWRDLSVWVRRRTEARSVFSRQLFEHKEILRNVSGVAKTGTVLAIMGGSGAGKTTLLATISARLKADMRGEILLNGHSVNQEFMTRISGFVPQNDLAVECLTVREHMEFMARLKMDRRLRTIQRHRRIYSLLTDLGLKKCSHTRLSALSGGERKRVCLAVQLLTDPPFLFCDEPTTGLDSYSAGAVVEHLRQFAARGKAVICTIHQPASGIFDLFHQVLFLAGGRVAFFGNVSDASKHFDNLGLVCPSTFNQAEFLVSQLAVVPGRETQCHKKIHWLCDEFDKSDYGEILFEELCKNSDCFQHSTSTGCSEDLGHTLNRWSSSPDSDSFMNERAFQKYLKIERPKCCIQFRWLIWRSLIEIRRQPTDILVRLAMLSFIAVLISTPYISITLDQKGVQNMQGLLYLIIAEIVFAYSYNVFHTFPREMPVLLRDISNGLYKAGPYYLSKMTILLPRALMEPFLYALVIFCVGDLRGGFGDFLVFCVPIWACAICATAYGCLMSAMFESLESATMISVPYEFISLTFCGIYFQIADLPSHLSWIPYISQFYYGNEAMSILQWEKINTIECDPDPSIPCLSTGKAVLDKYGFRPDHWGLDFLGLGAIYVFCHFWGFVAFWRRSKRQAVY